MKFTRLDLALGFVGTARRRGRRRRRGLRRCQLRRCLLYTSRCV
ncbi:hypothetical protein [Arthrobacter sp. KBS0703]|nr:hypothetical protein [Arthrobacter sp. KBS0703]